MTVLTLAWASAAALAMSGTVFGVCLTRLVWADDLRFARQIDAQRSQTEQSLRTTIEAQEKTINLLRKD